MSDPVLARLHHGMLQKTTYTDPHTQEEIEIFFHHPTHGEKGAACGLVGLEFGEDGGISVSEKAPVQGNAGTVAMMPSVYVMLATFCIEAVRGASGWPETPHHEQLFGMPQLTNEARKMLYQPALMKLGEYLFAKMEGTPEEKKDSEP